MKLLSTVITLDGIRCYAYHGVLTQERVVGGDYLVSLRLTLSDASDAVLNDHLAGTVNYAEVYKLIQREMAKPSALLEHVAGNLLKSLFEKFSLIEEAEVQVRKLNPPMGADCRGASVILKARR